jgi:hypothetical protein
MKGAIVLIGTTLLLILPHITPAAEQVTKKVLANQTLDGLKVLMQDGTCQ